MDRGGRLTRAGRATGTREPLKGLEQGEDLADGHVEAGLGEALGSPLRQRGGVLTQLLPLPPDFCRPASCWQGPTEPGSQQGQVGGAWACGGGGQDD